MTTVANAAPRLQASGRAFAHIANFYPEITAFRRDLHAHPELGFEEIYTARRVREALRACGVDELDVVETFSQRSSLSHVLQRMGLHDQLNAR